MYSKGYFYQGCGGNTERENIKDSNMTHSANPFFMLPQNANDEQLEDAEEPVYQGFINDSLTFGWEQFGLYPNGELNMM